MPCMSATATIGCVTNSGVYKPAHISLRYLCIGWGSGLSWAWFRVQMGSGSAPHVSHPPGAGRGPGHFLFMAEAEKQEGKWKCDVS